MTRHYYVVISENKTVIYSNLKKARAYVRTQHWPDVWEIFDNGISGALQVVRDGTTLSVSTFQHDRTKHPWPEMLSAEIRTPNGKVSKELLWRPT